MKKKEILCPASNKTHINVAVNEKVDAVYGGLQNWNARNRLVNFSFDEYNDILQKLHKNNIKFYLTLNILMLDEEIEEVISLFKSKRISLPDAFIVQDVGLAIILKKEFPKVKLHFSTQFGAHNKSDLEFIESLKGSRAIIARELQYEEIKNLSKDANIELEAFVHGFQCMSYSGVCLWGSLLNNGSGNRGKCLTLCRDIYSNEEFEGNLLYKPTLDCISMIDKLENIDSLKIEGRRRNAEEIRKVVQMVKNRTNQKNAGHIFGEDIEETNLFELVHSRMKPMYKYDELINVNKNDIFVDFDENNIPIKFTKEINHNSCYVYSEISNKYLLDKENISFEFIVEENLIRKINYQNNKGNTTFFVDDEMSDNLIKVSSKDFMNLFAQDGEINIYRIRYNRSKDDTYYINMRFLEKIRKFLLGSLLNDYIETEYIKNMPNQKIELYIESRDIKILNDLREDKRINLIFNVDTIEKLKRIDYYINELGDNIIYKLPLFNWKSEDLMPYYLKLQNYSVMFTRWSQILFTKDVKFKQRIIDYTVYVWNNYSVKYLQQHNIDIFTASPELSFSKNCNILKNVKKQFVFCGNIPLMYTRICFKHIFDCQICNKLKDKNISNKEKEISFKLKCTDDYRYLICDNPILNDYTSKKLENISLRYIIEEGGVEEIKRTINTILENPDNYYDKMKEIKLWENSYQANVDVSRY